MSEDRARMRGRLGRASAYPVAKPKAGSTQRAAKWGKVPEMGAWEVISPSEQREAYATVPTKA